MRIDSRLMKLSDGPLAIAVRPCGDRICLTAPGQVASLRSKLRGTVTIVDPYAHMELARIRVGRNPIAVTADPRGRCFYVANRLSNDISVIDIGTEREIGRIKIGKRPSALVCGELLYVVSRTASSMSVVDPDTRTVLDTVATGRGPMAITLSPSGDRVYVCAKLDGTVSAIDAGSLRVVGTVTVDRAAVDMALDPSGTRLYIANQAPQNITVVDTTAFETIQTIQLSTMSTRRGVGFFGDPVQPQPWAIGVSHDGTQLLIAFWEAGTLAILDATTGARHREVQLDKAKDSLGPINIAADWPHQRLYVACADHTLVTVHDDSPSNV